MDITIPFPPSTNRLRRQGRGFSYEPKEVKAFYEAAARAVREQWNGTTLTGPLDVSVTFFFRQASGDTDNRFKALLDALVKNRVIEDDRLVCRISAVRFKDSKNPRAEVRITLIPLTDPNFGRMLEAMPVKQQVLFAPPKKPKPGRRGKPPGHFPGV